MVTDGVDEVCAEMRRVEADGLGRAAASMRDEAALMLAAHPTSRIGRALGAYATILDLKAEALRAEAAGPPRSLQD